MHCSSVQRTGGMLRGCPQQEAGEQDPVGARKHNFGPGQGEQEDRGKRVKSWRLSSACQESCSLPAPGGDVVFGKGPTGWGFVSSGREIQPFLPSCVSQASGPCHSSQWLHHRCTSFLRWEEQHGAADLVPSLLLWSLPPKGIALVLRVVSFPCS